MKIEIEKLDAMLKEAGISFERHDGKTKSIVYREKDGKSGYGVYQTLDEECLFVGSLIKGEVKLELGLTAESVFDRIKKHWDAREKNE